MIPSKEMCKTALDNLLTQERFMNGYAFEIVKSFLELYLSGTEPESAKDVPGKKKTRKDKL